MADNENSEAEILEQEAKKIQLEEALKIETAKFTAAAFDRASTALVSVAVFTPLIGVIYKITTLAMLTRAELWMTIGGCFVLALILHWLGRGALKDGYEL